MKPRGSWVVVVTDDPRGPFVAGTYRTEGKALAVADRLEARAQRAAHACRCGDCDRAMTDCCDTLRPLCETVDVLDADDTVNVTTCRAGYGCDERHPHPARGVRFHVLPVTHTLETAWAAPTRDDL